MKRLVASAVLLLHLVLMMTTTMDVVDAITCYNCSSLDYYGCAVLNADVDNPTCTGNVCIVTYSAAAPGS